MSFDLILLDIMLPGADGFELMDLIRPTKTPVIFLTARGSSATALTVCAPERMTILSSRLILWS